jgi:hypothetical protein
MSNLTITLDEALLQAARAKAAREGTSVNEICRLAIERFAGREESVQRMLASFERLAAASLQALAQGAPAEVAWPGREALYQVALGERGLLRGPVAQEPEAP